MSWPKIFAWHAIGWISICAGVHSLLFTYLGDDWGGPLIPWPLGILLLVFGVWAWRFGARERVDRERFERKRL